MRIIEMRQLCRWIRAGFLASLVMAGLLGAGCSTNPATGRKQFNVIGTNQEISLGVQAAPGFLKSYGGEVPSEPIRQYVSELGHRLAGVSERPSLPWSFHVVDSQVINAFALPGGKVFISRGLLDELNNEAQLAGVLGHEVGHVTAQHIGQQMSTALGVQLIGVGIGVAANKSDDEWLQVLGYGVQAGGGVYLLKFGRDQELEADELGVRYMTRLGYNPVGQLQVMEVLRAASGGAKQPEFLSTHPLAKTRITRLEKLIKKQYPDHEDPAAYRFDFSRYKSTVTDRLAKLPPAAHTGQEAATKGQALRPGHDH